MKFIRKTLLFFSVGFSLAGLEAKTLNIWLDHSTSQNYQIHEELSTDALYCQQLTIKNTGDKPVLDCLPCANGRKYYTLNLLAKKLAKEKYPVLALYQIWQQSLTKTSESYSRSAQSPLDYLNYWGTCSSNEFEREFLHLCHLLGIDTKKANVKGKSAHDFCLQKDDWSYLDLSTGQFYLGWDNETCMSSEDLMDDPLLVLRSKIKRTDAFDFTKAWQELARLEIIAAEYAEEDTFPNPLSVPQNTGFDLYPQDQLVYKDSKENVNPYQLSIEHTFDWKERQSRGINTYDSPFPIQTIYNGTNVPLVLKNLQKTLQPSESYTLEKPIFHVEMDISQTHEGLITFTSQCARNLFPALKTGLNKINLQTKENKSVLKLTYEVDEKLENSSSPSIILLNQKKEFDCSPTFDLIANGQKKPELMWWQISSDKEFKTVPFNLEEIGPFANKVSLSLIAETFLNADENYYFRVKGCHAGQWGEWSKTFKFSVKKPQPLLLIEFDKQADNEYEINWERDAQLADETPIEYLIFGSNAFDFVPSIYGAIQPQEMINGKITIADTEDNLIAITTDTKILVDGRLAYYRIIARQNGQLSVPSPIIHVYDNDLVQPRSVLQIVEINEEKLVAKRVLFPVTYPWTEMALPRLKETNSLYENSLLKLESMILSLTNISENTKQTQDNKGYVRPSHVSKELWERMKPYFLPENHPWKHRIDRIFARSRASMNYETLKRAGFKGKVTHVRRIFAGVHPECVECFFKIYCDSEIYMKYPEWQKWLDRIHGKDRVKACIKKYGFEKWFSTPQKWCYPLPEHPACPSSPRYLPKDFILVCSNERPYEHKDNEKMWKDKLTKEMLDALYIIIDEAGMWDSVFAFNVPFCKPNGKMCFVDTEYSHKWPIRFEKLSKYMSSSNRKYWEHLIRNNGPSGYKSAHPNY